MEKKLIYKGNKNNPFTKKGTVVGEDAVSTWSVPDGKGGRITKRYVYHGYGWDGRQMRTCIDDWEEIEDTKDEEVNS